MLLQLLLFTAQKASHKQRERETERENFYFTKRGAHIRVNSAISFNTNTNNNTIIIDLKSTRFALRRVFYVSLIFSLPSCVFFSKIFSLFKKTQKVFFSVCRFLQKIFITLRENKERKRPERCLPPPPNASMLTTPRVLLLLKLLSRMKRKRRLWRRKEKRKKRREGKENPVGNLIIKITRTH